MTALSNNKILSGTNSGDNNNNNQMIYNDVLEDNINEEVLNYGHQNAMNYGNNNKDTTNIDYTANTNNNNNEDDIDINNVNNANNNIDEDDNLIDVDNFDYKQMERRVAALQKESERLTKLSLEQQLSDTSNHLTPTLSNAASLKQKLEADSRSIFVNQVEYSSTAKQLEQHFNGCGTINRITILKNHFGHPKGCAYIEFEHADAVMLAMALDNSLFNGRSLQVAPKRTNRPGMKSLSHNSSNNINGSIAGNLVASTAAKNKMIANSFNGANNGGRGRFNSGSNAFSRGFKSYHYAAGRGARGFRKGGASSYYY